MNNSENIKRALDSFFEDNVSVLVLKGAWGIGKTFYWNSYANKFKKRKDIKQIAYSYVSLFGLNSLDALKAKIFQNGEPIKENKTVKDAFDKTAQEEGRLFELTPWFENLKEKAWWRSQLIRRITRLGPDIPGINRVAALISSAEYGLVKNYAICFDDIERKGDKLTMKELMGLIDELSIKKGCKIILIFNDRTLDAKKDKEDFEKYREKVVDIEIEYRPTIQDNLLLIFSGQESYFPQLLGVFQTVDASNIRIFKKARWAIDKIMKLMSNCEQDMQNEIVGHLSLLCWGYYNSEKSLSFEFIRNNMKGSWLGVFSRQEKEASDEEKEWDRIISTLHFAELSCDICLIDLLEKGFLDATGFLDEIKKLDEIARTDKAKDKLYKAWRIYASSFQDNEAQFIEALKEVLDTEMEKIDIYNFDSSIQAIEEFGEDVSKYVDRYIAIHSKTLSKADIRDLSFGREIRNTKFKTELTKIKDNTNDILSIDAVVQKISDKESWNQEDIEFLVNLTIEDLYTWMIGSQDDIIEKIKNGLLFFDKLHTQNNSDREKFALIANNTKEALRKVASTNSFNKTRVRNLFNIRTENTEE